LPPLGVDDLGKMGSLLIIKPNFGTAIYGNDEKNQSKDPNP
jgi:hypothetical protein